MHEAPTKRQLAIYEFILRRVSATQTAPSVREICRHFGIGSPNGINYSIKALVKKGLLKHLGRGLSRGYVPAKRPHCPHCGKEL